MTHFFMEAYLTPNWCEINTSKYKIYFPSKLARSYNWVLLRQGVISRSNPAQECDRGISCGAIACLFYCTEGDKIKTMLKQKPSPESVLITEQETEAIKKLQQLLSIESAQVKLVASNGEEILIPESVYNLLGQVVRAMASGQAVSIVTHNRELTVHQAADLLNVSRSFLVKLLDEGAIPYIEIDSRRRILFKDLMIYKEKRKVQRRKLLDELIEMTEEAGLYEE